MDPLVSIDRAEALVREHLTPPRRESVALRDAVGRVLMRPVLADRDLPPYSRAMMDGIAFSSAALSQPFEIAGLHAAGDPPPGPLPAGSAWEIMTGACLPSDCDTVVPYEHLEWPRRPDADRSNGGPPLASCREPHHPGQCIHPAGSDARAGDMLAPPGTRIGPAEIAIAASVGLTQLEVAARPRIGLVSSGDEAVPAEQQPEPWQIRRSNGPMLEAVLRHIGHVPVSHDHIPDEPEAARETLDRVLAQADLILICGGISKGKRDLIRPLLEKSLAAPVFHGVAQKPGKPLAFWAGPPHVFALPGNPVSVLATFTRHVLPALARLEGREPDQTRRPLPDDIEPIPHLTWLLALDASGHPRPSKNSGDFVSIAGTTGFLEIPPASDFDPDRPFRFFPIPANR